MHLQSFIKWSGSKRLQAKKIVSYFPNNINTYYEPFVGSGIVLGYLKPKRAVINDINKSLIELWKLIQSEPDIVVELYKKDWDNLQKKGYEYFYKIRSQFNLNNSPCDLLFLSRTCVNGLIRYNRNGGFNNSFHHSRKGINPDKIKNIIYEWNKIIKDYKFESKNYLQSTDKAMKGDFIYLDPPYFNTKNMYFGPINYEPFIKYLQGLNKKKIKFALSFDGTRGNNSFIVKIPKNIYKKHLLIKSGNSSFLKTQNKKIEAVKESLYLNY